MIIYATFDSGYTEYDIKDARVSIDEFIEALEQARDDGATYVVGLSNNYRGASFVRVSLPEVDWEFDDEEEEDE